MTTSQVRTPARPGTGQRPQGSRLAQRPGVFPLLVAGLVVVVVVSATAGVMIGPVPVPARQVWRIALHGVAPDLVTPDWSAVDESIVLLVRFPRVLLAVFVGSGLAVIGTTLQALVRNPLADPYILGITSGASVGAVAVLLLGVSAFGIYSLSASAFLGALAAFALVFVMAQKGGKLYPLRLVLAGVAVSYVLSAITSFMVFRTGDTGRVQSVLFWLLGGLGGARWSFLTLPAATVALGTGYLVAQARNLNALLIGDETATSLGVDLHRFRKQLFTVTAALTGVIVAVSGGIGFVGLMLPHVTRLLVGSDHRRVLPVAALVGAIFLIWVDVIARTAAAPDELPLSIVTALFGGPFFLWLLRRGSAAGGAEAGAR